MQSKQWSKGASKFPASMAMRTKFAAQILKNFDIADFFWFLNGKEHSQNKNGHLSPQSQT
jgi:hypothetical protein